MSAALVEFRRKIEGRGLRIVRSQRGYRRRIRQRVNARYLGSRLSARDKCIGERFVIARRIAQEKRGIEPL